MSSYTFNGGFDRIGEINILVCDCCICEKIKKCIVIDSSEEEYIAGRICQDCINKLFSESDREVTSICSKLYQKFLSSMRCAYEHVAQDVDPEDFNNDNIMYELTIDADRMYMFGELSWDEQKWFYKNVPDETKWEMFKKIR